MSVVVSIVSYPFLPARVGGQKGVALFYKYFSRHLKLICVTTRMNVASEAEGYEVLPILSNSPLRYINPFYFFTLKRILKENEATHLLLEHPYYGWLGYWLKRSLKIQLIAHSHNIEGLRWKSLGKWWWKILWQYEKFTHRHADANFFIQEQDMHYAIKKFGLDPARCIVATYGIERNSAPPPEERAVAKQKVAMYHQLDVSKPLLLFNGAFEYSPNLDALNNLIHHINPMLAAKTDFNYHLVICGRGIPADISSQKFPNVTIAGFVDDVELYFNATDVFLNPIVSGGGIKTKLVEALGNNCNVVSTKTGSIGVDPSLCNGKLFLTEDNDWKEFSNKVREAANNTNEIGDEFSAHFYWGYITSRAERFIEKKPPEGRHDS